MADMRTPSVVSPRFQEDKYKGQDVVHRGVRIPLGIGPYKVRESFSRNARRILDKDVEGVTFRDLEQKDLYVLRQFWFDKEDPTFPREMGTHVGMVAVFDGTIIGGAIWKPEGQNLFLHQLVTSPSGKGMQIGTHLIWQSVLKFSGGLWHSLDIGVSYNPGRMAFFKNFAVERYPVILKKPFYVPVIRLSPFRSLADKTKEQDLVQWKKWGMTFLPRGIYAIEAALRHINVQPGDHISIVKTFGSEYITRCVTNMIEKLGCTWSLRGFEENTKAVIAIHEFGVPVYQEQDMNILDRARKLMMPIIEDCAWMNTQVWEWSSYQVFSMQKMLNMNYGGVLKGIYIDDEQLWKWGLLDYVKRQAVAWEPEHDSQPEVRVKNWRLYHKLVTEDGMMPDDCYDYVAAIDSKVWVPTVYMQKFETDEIANDIVARLEEFGIQAGRYWGENVVFLPIHQNMSEREVEYMFAVVRGYFNSCRDFK